MTDEEIERRLNEAKPSFIKNGGLLPPEDSTAHLVTSGLDGDGPNRHLPRKPNENFGLGAASAAPRADQTPNKIGRFVIETGGVWGVETLNFYGVP